MEATFSHPLYLWLAVVTGVALVGESVWLVITRGLRLSWAELAADLFIFLGVAGLRFATRGLYLAMFLWLARCSPWQLETNAVTALVAFLGVDLLHYAWHRYLHHQPLGWALHSVHHTAETYALALGGRLSWPLRLVDGLVALPFALLGFEPELIYLCVAVSFVVQFLAHAAGVGRLGPLDWVLNTPSNHRVHHHLDGPGQRHNYGAALIVWDQLFGTWQREAEGDRPVFGVRELPSRANPLVIQAQGLVQWWKAR